MNTDLRIRLDRAVEKLRELAEECAECGGDGVKAILTDKGYVGECPACHDIRLVIAVCTAEPTSNTSCESSSEKT